MIIIEYILCINVETFLIHELNYFLESLREYVVAKVKNNAQNKALTEIKSSNDLS